ncbi:hypothetical protein CRENBAI_004522 [Crenichthys baileyi]|uniref:Uncharacterized protein n=1 Tax=Crenichthys baileyi TaxID=28760 RepID=A0AAV9R1D1_9TELE
MGSIDREYGPTTEKRGDQLAQCNQNTPHKGGHMTNMPNPTAPGTTGQSQPSTQSPMAGTRPQPQPERENHQHPCQPSRNDRAKPSCSSPRANATATPHILPYIGRGTVKTTNPKHTPPTRNHPADKQTPPQYKTEKPDATAEPSDARPAVQNREARAPMHRTTTPTPQHAKKRRTERSNEHPKQKPCTKPTLCKYAPTSPPKTKPPAKVHPHEKKTYSIQVQEHRPHTPA